VKRPSHGEIAGKIRKAKEAAQKGLILIMDPAVLASDALELGYDIQDISEILLDLLDNVSPRGYIGQPPPERSYKDQITDCELFAFRCFSSRLGCDVYLKVALEDEHIWVVSLHEPRRVKGEEQ